MAAELKQETPESKPTKSRTSPLWLLLLVLPLLLTAIRYPLERWRTPGEADFAQAAQHVRSQIAPEDRLAVVPAWAQRAMAQVGDLNPTFDPMLDERPPAADRLWVIAEPEGKATLDNLASRYPEQQRQQFGKLTVACYKIGKQRLFHAVDHLLQAQVTLVGEKEEIACDIKKTDRWDCRGRPDWQHVGAEWLDVDLAPRKVIWAHPPPDNEKLRLRFAGVTLGNQLEVLAGHTVHGATFATHPVEVVARVGGQEVGRLSREPGYPLKSYRFDTKKFSGLSLDLELDVFTSSNGASHFAIDAVVLD